MFDDSGGVQRYPEMSEAERAKLAPIMREGRHRALLEEIERIVAGPAVYGPADQIPYCPPPLPGADPDGPSLVLWGSSERARGVAFPSVRCPTRGEAETMASAWRALPERERRAEARRRVLAVAMPGDYRPDLYGEAL